MEPKTDGDSVTAIGRDRLEQTGVKTKCKKEMVFLFLTVMKDGTWIVNVVMKLLKLPDVAV